MERKGGNKNCPAEARGQRQRRQSPARGRELIELKERVVGGWCVSVTRVFDGYVQYEYESMSMSMCMMYAPLALLSWEVVLLLLVGLRPGLGRTKG